MKKFNAFVIVAFVLLSATSAHATQVNLGTTTPVTTPVFSRNLSIGMIGQDVSALNAVLNIEFNTTISNPGTFGADTQAYVTKLQERYAADILTPNGLTAGTGFVGPYTRTKLNVLAQQYNITLAQFPTPVVYVQPGSNNPQIFTQTLSLGSVSSQVTLLKTVLNSDPATALVYTKSSEVSDPSDLFDTATQAAVVKFQNKYATDILVPNNMTAGNGVVGSYTRKKLNQVLATLSATSTVAQNSSGNQNNTSVNTITTQNTGDNGTTDSSGYCASDSWTCSDWSPCASDGIQTRTCTINFMCTAANANHNLDQATVQNCSPNSTGVSGVGAGVSNQTSTTSTLYSKTYNYVADNLIHISSSVNGTVTGTVPSAGAGFDVVQGVPFIFNITGLESIYHPGDTINAIGEGYYDDTQFNDSIDVNQINMYVNGVELFQANNKYGKSTDCNIEKFNPVGGECAGTATLTAPSTPGNYNFHVTCGVSEVYIGNPDWTQLSGPPLPDQISADNWNACVDDLPYTVVSSSTPIY